MNIMESILGVLEARASEDNANNKRYVRVSDVLTEMVGLLKKYNATGPALVDLPETLDGVSVNMPDILRRASDETQSREREINELREDALKSTRAIVELQSQVQELRRADELRVRSGNVQCGHPSSKVIRGVCGSAKCSLCDALTGGWYCPASPDRVCHYTTDGGMVELSTGREVPMPDGHDPRSENYDECIYCGEPEERK